MLNYFQLFLSAAAISYTECFTKHPANQRQRLF